MILEARAENCFSSTHVLKINGQAVGKFEGRFFSEGLDLALTGLRRFKFEKSGFFSSQFHLKDAETGAVLTEAQPAGIFRSGWKLNLKKRPHGRLVFLRRSNGLSEVTLLGQTWQLGQVWPHRLVRCEVDLDHDKVRFCTLRRKEPASQPQILEVDYRLPNRGFQD